MNILPVEYQRGKNGNDIVHTLDFGFVDQLYRSLIWM
jgi:hypothetical protein